VLSISSTDLGGVISADLYSAPYRLNDDKINSMKAHIGTSLAGIFDDT
jgi:hypothetical protein